MTRILLPCQVGIVVAASRAERGLTQAQVADAAGVSRQLVNRLESGSATGIALDKLLAILNATGCVLEVHPIEPVDGREVELEPAVASPSPFVGDPLDEYPLDESLFLESEGAPR
ncbi:MAG: helix-turn-helix transcriptional regulator [Atopobiaceae bacterium]|nr:helix-turn-helix transcriptional regulator [Atopobiaceae bacterium]